MFWFFQVTELAKQVLRRLTRGVAAVRCDLLLKACAAHLPHGSAGNRPAFWQARFAYQFICRIKSKLFWYVKCCKTTQHASRLDERAVDHTCGALASCVPARLRCRSVECLILS